MAKQLIHLAVWTSTFQEPVIFAAKTAKALDKKIQKAIECDDTEAYFEGKENEFISYDSELL